jgi:hypothetical protein
MSPESEDDAALGEEGIPQETLSPNTACEKYRRVPVL